MNTHDDMLDLIRKKCKYSGQEEFRLRYRIDQSQFSKIFRKEAAIPLRVLAALGYKQVPMYEKVI